MEENNKKYLLLVPREKIKRSKKFLENSKDIE